MRHKANVVEFTLYALRFTTFKISTHIRRQEYDHHKAKRPLRDLCLSGSLCLYRIRSAKVGNKYLYL